MDKYTYGVAYCYECPFLMDSAVDEKTPKEIELYGETHHILTNHNVNINMQRELS